MARTGDAAARTNAWADNPQIRTSQRGSGEVELARAHRRGNVRHSPSARDAITIVPRENEALRVFSPSSLSPPRVGGASRDSCVEMCMRKEGRHAQMNGKVDETDRRTKRNVRVEWSGAERGGVELRGKKR